MLTLSPPIQPLQEISTKTKTGDVENGAKQGNKTKAFVRMVAKINFRSTVTWKDISKDEGLVGWRVHNPRKLKQRQSG